MFTIGELASYLPETADNPIRAGLIRDLTLGVVYEVLPQAYADASPVAKAIGLEVAARAFRNADGYTSESVDDWTGRREGSRGEPGVYLTAGERSRLATIADGASRPRVRSVQLSSWSAPS
jgi:hypothetical protein